MTSKEIIANLQEAAQANLEDNFRKGNRIELSGPGEVFMTGDLHGHQRNFERITAAADLAANPRRHLIIHELLHSSQPDHPQQCHSYELVAQAAELKCRFPEQVHILMGNHAMAQMTCEEVLKAGRRAVQALNTGLAASYGSNADYVSQSLDAFLLSLPLAARTDNGFWMSHSIPARRHLKDFDDAIFCKQLELKDIRNNQSLHALLWDRNYRLETLQLLQQRWHAQHFIIGHQPTEKGYEQPFPGLTILASEHAHGCYLLFDLKKGYEHDELSARIRPLAEIA